MNNFIKKDLLRRKIREHFKRNPGSKTVVIKANIGGDTTVWKVRKEGKTFNVVEVVATREHFIITEAPVGGQFPAGGSVPLAKGSSATMGTQPAGKSVGGIKDMDVGSVLSLVQSGAQKVDSDVIAKVMAPVVIPQDSGLKKQLKTTWDILNRASNKDAAASSFLGMMQNLMNTPEWLRASKDPSLAEADDPPPDSGKKKKDEKSEKNRKKFKKSEKPIDVKVDIPKPKMADVRPDVDAGLETGVTSAPGTELGGAPEVPKRGEEVQLQQLVQNKPVKDIKVSTDDQGGHISLSLGGLEVPLEIHISRDGKATFEVGELSRTLSTGPSRAQGTAET